MKKKKNAPGKNAGAPEFSVKEFTPEEDRIYEEAVNAYRGALSEGKKLKDVYAAYVIDDEDLRSIVQADFLKILIAERHFGSREPLDAIAKDIDVAIDVMQQTLGRMLQEVGAAQASKFVQETGGVTPKNDD